jgi:histidinol-phosphate aminotransferase
MQHFARTRMQFSVSNVAAAGALAALDDTEHIQLALENNSLGAAWLSERVRGNVVRVAPTWANFLYLETDEDGDLLADRIQKEGVIVRALTQWGAPTALRVTIGTPEQNEKFVSALYSVRK